MLMNGIENPFCHQGVSLFTPVSTNRKMCFSRNPIFSLIFTCGLTLLVDLYAVPGRFGDEQAALRVYVD